MFSNLRLRHLLIGLAVLSLIIKLGFIFGKKQTPVMWDARIYSSVALGLIYKIQDGGAFGHPEKLSSSDSAFQQGQFDIYLAKYVTGEQIDWLYYKRPTMATAQEYLFISGPILPAFLTIFIWQNIFSDFTLIRIANAIVDTFSVLLLFLIAHQLFGRRIGLLASFLYIIYMPFTIICGMITPEPITMSLILAVLYVILLWYKHQNPRFLYIAGLALGLLVLAKPTASLLFFPFIVGFLIENKNKLKQILPFLAKAAIPFAAVVIPWFIMASLYFGKPAIRDPRYSEANFRSSSSIKYEGYDLDFVEKDFWTYSVSEMIIDDPIGYGKLLVKKFARLWSNPFNEFGQTYLIPHEALKSIHLVLIIAALFGIIYFISNGYGFIYLLLILLYYSMVHIVFHSLARYNLNAMPFVIIASSAIFVKIFDGLYRIFAERERHRFLAGNILSALAVISFLFIPLEIPVGILGHAVGVWLILAIKAVLLIGAIYYLYQWLLKISSKTKAACSAFISGGILLIIMLVIGAAPENWAEWKCELDNPNQSAGVKVYPSKNISLSDIESVAIRADLSAQRETGNKFIISVNGAKSGFAIGEPPASLMYYKKATYPVFEKLMDIHKEEMRHWSYFRIPGSVFKELIDRDGFIDISISAAGADKITLYGNYPIIDGDSILIPDLYRSSIEKMIDKGDPRIWQKYPLSSDSAISYFVSDMKSDNRSIDLTPSFGNQVGRYRIYIEAITNDGRIFFF
jgi:4-amino-4-deoxy-L-arabinose transferase-like glycosyltransferase